MHKQAPASWPRRIKRGALSLSVIAAVAVTLGMVKRSATPFGSLVEHKARALAVQVLTVRIETKLTQLQHFVGVVEAHRESRIGFELGGQVASVQVDEGDTVEEGQLLARLDTALLDAERMTLLAARDEVAARLSLASLTRGRVREARALDAVSSQTLDVAETEHDVLLSALARANAAVAQIDARLEKALITAPFDGIVAKRHLDEGQIAPAGAPVIYLLEASNPEARIGVASRAAAELSAGDTHLVTVDGRPLTARIVSLLPLRNARTRTVEVRLVLDGTLHELRRGDLVGMDIERSREATGTWLPLSALTESSRGTWAVYAVVELSTTGALDGATHQLVRRDVEVLQADSERVFVLGTLGEGDRVVFDGLQRLAPDQRVRIASDVARNRPNTNMSAGANGAESESLTIAAQTTTQEQAR